MTTLKQSQALETLTKALNEFAAEARAVMPIRHLLVFLQIARSTDSDGVSLQDLADSCDVSSAAITRIVQELGEFNRKAEPGLKLVEYNMHLADRRFKPVVLTKKGRALANRLAATMGG
jgi:DNA-binding MarR family transcriptional regulator